MFWLLFFVGVATFCVWKCYDGLSYWKRKGVIQASFLDILVRNWYSYSPKHTVVDMVSTDYKHCKNKRYGGGYQFLRPMLTIKDPELIKQITVKDFDHFMDRVSLVSEDADPLWATNLFSLTGEKWKEMRATLSPSFTSSKMRSMFVLISECAEKLTDYFLGHKKDLIEVNMKDVFTRYANDVIASAGFGISCDSLTHKNNEFYLMGKQLTDFSGFGMLIKMFVLMIAPGLFNGLGLRIFSKKVSNFFTNIIKETIKVREKEGTVRPDMIHLLMEARKGNLSYDGHNDQEKETGFATVEESHIGKDKTVHKKTITDIDITAQALIFFFAGFETVSTTLSFMAYELALNPQIQQKLYGEIKETLDQSKDGKLSYEIVPKMKYLDMVVSETLRKWPPLMLTHRVCTKPYTITPVDVNERPVLVEKGTIIFLPQFPIHRDEKYYPNPERFDPERFNEENKKNIDPYTYFPFGTGPRNCIGSRFALLEVKAVFVQLLSKFEIVVTEKTPIPVVLSKYNLNVKGGLWVGLKRRNES